MDDLTLLVEKLKNAFHDGLVSVTLYGSAAPGGTEDMFSDLNILCVLKQVTPAELEDGEPVMRWWRGLDHPAPILLSETEVAHSSDSFPIEFYDMKERRKVLFGVDVIEHLQVDTRNYRTQVEHELRAKMLRLRQHAGHVLSDGQALLTLCLNSSSTFCVLGRHALILAGVDAPLERRAVVRKLADLLKTDMSAFARLIEIREYSGNAAVPDNPRVLFGAYLECIRKIVEYVDGLG
jgi:predicted nucleotidyltransferase